MDEVEFDKLREAGRLADVGEHHPLYSNDDGETPYSARLRKVIMGDQVPERLSSSRGVVWVRASDLLSTGAGRVAGRGINFEADLARRLHRAPATSRRAILNRADRLPPLSEFGSVRQSAPFAARGLGRR